MIEANSYYLPERGTGSKAERERALIISAKKGDKDAYAELYRQHMDEIYRYIFYRVGETYLAEDLMETVFLNTWENLPRFRIGEIPFRSWLYRVAHNLIVDHYRTKKTQYSLSHPAELVDPLPSPEESIINQERSERIAEAISQLHPEYQQILTLRFISGLDHTEAAQVLNRSVGAVRVLQFRALRALSEVLGKRRGESDV